jgi:hypothetical protein
MRENAPFRFVGKLAERNTRLFEYVSSGNEVMACVEAGLNLIDMAENVTKYHFETQNTVEIQNQTDINKDHIDTKIKIERQKSEHLIANKKMQIENELHVNRYKLNKELGVFKKKLENRAYESQNRNELFLKNWDVCTEIRNSLKMTLRIVETILEEGKSRNINQNQTLTLLEEYRETQNLYNKLIGKLA